jgi:alpha,alpha-trehalose phosphorylase
MRDHSEILHFAPRLPSRLTRLSFRLSYRGRCLRVDVRSDQAHYQLLNGDALELVHHGERLTVEPGASQTRPVPPPPKRSQPDQPAGRAPRRRGGQD